MTIWLLAVVLLASLAGAGYRQGGVRAAISFLGILVAALLSVPLGKLVKPILKAMGMTDPVLIWALAPLIMFVTIMILVKVGALAAHQKVDVHYKYHAGDLRLALWERLNHRLGLCVGLLNGALYLIMIMWVIYAFSYWTVQTAAADTDPKTVRILNRLGHDLDSTGLSRVAKAVDRLPASYYDMADFAGLIYNNPLAEARLSRYPGFLTLAERPEFQALGSDATFAKLRQERNPMLDLIHNPSVASIITNPDLLNQIWTTVAPNLKDLQTFLDTGKSPKYAGQKIVGRWSFSVNGTMTAQRRAKPNISSSDMKKFKQWVTGTFAKSSFVAMPENQAILKNTPLTGVGAGAGAILNGRWQDLDGVKYQLSFTGGGGIELPASVEGERLTIKAPGAETPAMVFERED